MKVTLGKEAKYYVIYFYVPQLEGKPRKISARVPLSDPKAESKAKKIKRDWEQHLSSVGTSGLLPRKTLLDVIAAKSELILHPQVTLKDAAEFYAKHNVPRGRAMLVSEAVVEYLATEEDRNLNKSTYQQYKTRCNAFGKKFGKREVNTLQGPELVAWVTSLGGSAVTQWGYLGCVSRVMNYCVSEKAIKESPISAADEKRMPKKKNASAPDILTGELGQKFFASFPLHHKAMLCILYFTGMRIETGKSVTWGDVDVGNKVINIPAEADKAGKERFIEGVPERMWEILAQLPKQPANSPIVPSDRKLKTARAAGMKGAGISTWPKNALRRSFASHHLNYKNPSGTKDKLTETLLIMCHTEKPTVFWNNYFRRSRPDDAAIYFDVGLTPKEKRSLGIK